MTDPLEFVRQTNAMKDYNAEEYFRDHPWDKPVREGQDELLPQPTRASRNRHGRETEA